jgi:hypothetical protein
MPCVTASITEEIQKTKKMNEPTRVNTTNGPTQVDTMNKLNWSLHMTLTSQEDLTQGEWDSGSEEASHKGSVDLTGKLCWHVMALIWWQVGTDKAVNDCMVQALEQWLHRRWISIYTDLV